MKILIINGPNLNLINKRKSSLYGEKNLDEIETWLESSFKNKSEIEFFQSNIEGEIVSKIQELATSDRWGGLIINPGGYSHTSIAIYDALELCEKPKLEVHLSQVYRRGAERQFLTARACDGVISGLKEWGYYLAIEYLEESFNHEIPNN